MDVLTENDLHIMPGVHMSWLIAWLFVGPVLAEDAEACDPDVILQELTEASPVVVPDVWGRLVQCDAEAGREAVGDAFSRTLAGDAANAAVVTALEQVFGEVGEPALDLVEPAGVGRGVVQGEAGMASQPGLDRRGLVGAVVVRDQVDLQVRGDHSSGGEQEQR